MENFKEDTNPSVDNTKNSDNGQLQEIKEIILNKQVKGVKFRTILFSLIIAAAFLIITLSVQYISTEVLKVGNTPKQIITDWQFVFGNTDEDISGTIDKWKLANSSKPIKKTKISNKYLRLNLTLPPSEEEHILNILTNYCPIKVLYNGDKIYNSGYGQKKYSGNISNQIVIPGNTSEYQIDIFMYIPFDVSVNAYLQTSPHATSFAFYNYLSIALSCTIIFIGLILILIASLISIRSKSIIKLLALGITVFVSGNMIALLHISEATSLVSNPVFYNVQLYWNIVLSFLFVLVTYLCYTSNKTGSITVGMIIVSILFLLIMPIRSPLVLMIITGMAIVTLIIAMAFVLIDMSKRIEEGMPFAKVALVTFLYANMVNIYNLYCTFTSGLAFSGFIVCLAAIVFCITFFVIFLKQDINKYIRIEERKKQTNKDSQWLNKVTGVLTHLLEEEKQGVFIEKAVEGILEILNGEIKELIEIDGYETSIKNKCPKATAAILTSGAYVEIINKENVEGCDYNAILSDLMENKYKGIRFASTYLDMVLKLDNKPSAILHFENIYGGLSNRFQSVIEAVYNNIQVAYTNIIISGDMAKAYEDVFTSLAQTVEYKSVHTKTHLYAVKEITGVLCHHLGFNEKETEIISSAAMVHDIGKIAIPESILNSSRKLTSQEKEIMNNHVLYGYNILSQSSSSEFMRAAAVIAQQHHEKYNGTGNLGLKGEDIHIYARIVAVADVFDALSSARSYKEEWSFEKCYDYINEKSGIEFDPEVVKAFNLCKDEIINIKKKA